MSESGGRRLPRRRPAHLLRDGAAVLALALVALVAATRAVRPRAACAAAASVPSLPKALGGEDGVLLGIFLAVTVAISAVGDRRRSAKEMARRSENRFRDGIGSRMLAITFWNASGGAFEPNDAYLDLLGYTRADLRRRPLRWQDITPPEQLELAHRALAELRATGICPPLEMEYVRKDGRRVPVLVGAALLGEGGYAKAVSFALDLTERRRVESQMWQAARAKDEFLATLAHELRNGLAPLVNALYLARLDRPDGRDHALALADHQVKSLTRLVDDLVDVARICHGKITLLKEPVDLCLAVERVVESCRLQLAARDHRFTLSLPPQHLYLEADPVRLEQVLTNLLGNAIKYTDPGGHISLTGEQVHHEIVLRVRDTGIGIEPDILPHVFDPFVQGLRRPDRAAIGLGIGLTIVRHMVGLHGGTVEARSEGAGQGSEFILRLPALPAGRAETTSKLPSDESRARSLRVVVGEDDAATAVSLKTVLEMAGHRVAVAHDGPTALDAARVHAPEVMLIDLGLPRVDGYEVARRMRQEAGFQGILLVAVSGHGRAAEKERARDAGFDHHLLKPVQPEVLFELLRGWTRARARSDRDVE
jgi:PAS domain S-box-containing protein